MHHWNSHLIAQYKWNIGENPYNPMHFGAWWLMHVSLAVLIVKHHPCTRFFYANGPFDIS